MEATQAVVVVFFFIAIFVVIYSFFRACAPWGSTYRSPSFGCTTEGGSGSGGRCPSSWQPRTGGQWGILR
jgi:hypothetical protein